MNSYKDHFENSQVSIDLLYKNLNNLTYRERLKNHFMNRMRFLGSHYRYAPNSAQVESYSERMIENRIKEQPLEKSIKHCINYLDKFPSWSELYNVLKSNSKHIAELNSKNHKDVDKYISEAEFDLENRLKSKFIETFGEDGLERYVDYYTNKVVGFDQDNSLGVSVNFTRSALFDWHCAYYNPKNVKKVYDEKSIHAIDKRVYFINQNDIPDILRKHNNKRRF